jgi:hypothetical protein
MMLHELRIGISVIFVNCAPLTKKDLLVSFINKNPSQFFAAAICR